MARTAWHAEERVEFLIEATGGVRALAETLGVSPSQPTRWRQGKDFPSPQLARRIVDLDHVIASLLQVWEPETAMDWLQSANGHLDGARPIDVLRLRSSSEVVAALRAEAEGAFV